MPVCAKCKSEKEHSEFPKGNRDDGTASYCLICYRSYQKEWREKNKESEIARYARYREQNREKIRESSRERMRAKRALNPDGARRYTREYRAKNPDRAQAWDAKKKAVRRLAVGSDCITASQWKEIKARFKNSCVYCLRPMKRLQMDHVIPLARGGRHTADNIVPACGPCNSSKQAKDALEWVNQKHGRLV